MHCIGIQAAYAYVLLNKTFGDFWGNFLNPIESGPRRRGGRKREEEIRGWKEEETEAKEEEEEERQK